jgi:hypothetical protein
MTIETLALFARFSNYSVIDLIHWLKEECTHKARIVGDVYSSLQSTVSQHKPAAPYKRQYTDDLPCTPPHFSLPGLYAAASSQYEL